VAEIRHEAVVDCSIAAKNVVDVLAGDLEEDPTDPGAAVVANYHLEEGRPIVAADGVVAARSLLVGRSRLEVVGHRMDFDGEVVRTTFADDVSVC
jgi:hypothetical protein